MPRIRQPVVLDLATPLTRRRRRVRITALLVIAGLVASLTLLLSPARRTVTTSNDNIVPGKSS